MPTSKNPSSADEVVTLEQQLRDRESEHQAESAALHVLTDRLEAGEDVPVKTVTEQHWVIDALNTALGGLRRRLSAAQARARLDRLDTLRAEIETRTATDDQLINTAIREATEATARAITAVEDRNARLRGWSQLLIDEGVSPFGAQWSEPSRAHAGMSPGTGSFALAVGAKRLHLAGENVVDQITRGARAIVDGKSPATEAPARLVTIAKNMPDDLRWFTTPEGDIMAFQPSQLPAHVLRSWESGYHEITRTEARALIDGAGKVGQDVTPDQAAAAAGRAQTSGTATKRAA